MIPRTMIPRTLWMAVLGFSILSGCATEIMVNKSGPSYPPYSENCKLTYDYGDFGKAYTLINAGSFVQVGSISVPRGGPSLTQSLKDLVRPKSCQLGGTLVLLDKSSNASLIVLRKIQ